jgi:hypothetical protein
MEVSVQLHFLAALPTGKKVPGTHRIGGWVGPRAGLDAVVERKILSPCRDSKTGRPALSSFIIVIELCGTFKVVTTAEDRVPNRMI